MSDQKACTEKDAEKRRKCIFWNGYVCWDGRRECHHTTHLQALELQMKGERVTG